MVKRAAAELVALPMTRGIKSQAWSLPVLMTNCHANNLLSHTSFGFSRKKKNHVAETAGQVRQYEVFYGAARLRLIIVKYCSSDGSPKTQSVRILGIVSLNCLVN